MFDPLLNATPNGFQQSEMRARVDVALSFVHQQGVCGCMFVCVVCMVWCGVVLCGVGA